MRVCVLSFTPPHGFGLVVGAMNCKKIDLQRITACRYVLCMKHFPIALLLSLNVIYGLSSSLASLQTVSSEANLRPRIFIYPEVRAVAAYCLIMDLRNQPGDRH